LPRPVLRKLKQLDRARRIEDLRAPPAKRLERLKGARVGQWSIRVNDQFRGLDWMEQRIANAVDDWVGVGFDRQICR